MATIKEVEKLKPGDSIAILNHSGNVMIESIVLNNIENDIKAIAGNRVTINGEHWFLSDITLKANRSKLQYTLTDDQKVAFILIRRFLRSDKMEFTLSGVSGSGKSWVIQKALAKRSNVVGTTVSHSAKNILTESMGGNIQCYTIARLLGLKMQIDDEGAVRFLPLKKTDLKLPIETADILVVDECSMIDKETNRLIHSLKNANCKVIYLGDEYQLQPIADGDTNSVTFNTIHTQMNQPVRYSGPILELGNRIKEEINKDVKGETATKHLINEWMTELGYESRTSVVNEDGSGIIFINSIHKMLEISAKQFKKSTGINDFKLLAYRNKTVKTLNAHIRTLIYDKETHLIDGSLPQYVNNELVICDGGYSVNLPHIWGVTRHAVINNNEVFRITDSKHLKGPHDIPALAVTLDPAVPIPDGEEIYVLDEDDENGVYRYDREVENLKELATEHRKSSYWVSYYSFMESFATFVYAYAQNVFKSQGCTYTEVVVFEDDILSIKKNQLKNKLQSLYVACTRAKHRVYIYNKKYQVDHSLLPKKVREELGI